MVAQEGRSEERRWTRDLIAGILGTFLAFLLLWYLHAEAQPGWALVCGGLGGIVTRRWIRTSYASFPHYLRVPLSVGVVALGTTITSWATLAREPLAYWLLRWREAVTLPILGSILGLGLAGIIYTHRRLEREVADRRRLEEDLEIARQIQENLLRSGGETPSWIDACAVNRASRQVGGDYYELMQMGDGGLRFAVGDVSGKGVPAALLMSSLQTSFLAACSTESELHDVCAHVNRFLVSRTTPERYATFFVGHLTRDGRLLYVNAGHNPAIVVGPRGQRQLIGGGFPLGLFDTAKYELQELRLEPDEVLLVYTDGVTEAADAAEREFGTERLTDVAMAHGGDTAEEISTAILHAVAGHTDTVSEQADDITLLVLRSRGPA